MPEWWINLIEMSSSDKKANIGLMFVIDYTSALCSELKSQTITLMVCNFYVLMHGAYQVDVSVHIT